MTASSDEIDHRSAKGPLLSFLSYDDDENDDELYRSGTVGADGNIYFLPSHAKRVLVVDPRTNQLSFIGPEMQGSSKWLHGIQIDDKIYGLPYNSDCVLRIHTPTADVSTLPIPYESFYSVNDDKSVPIRQRRMKRKYNGGALSPIDGCIYSIPFFASHVLKIDPITEECQLVGPELPGQNKWYGGIVGKQDGAIYGIPHDFSGVLRIHPTAITVHGDFGTEGQKWHGATVARNGTIVCVPASANSVLCILPKASRDPKLTLIGYVSGVSGDDRNYKYLGARAAPNGKVFLFPSHLNCERILQVDTKKKVANSVGPIVRDEHHVEQLCQDNNWQNGVLSVSEGCVYSIPLTAQSVMRIDCHHNPPRITTWPMPALYRGLAKYEGGVNVNGVIYTVPNNLKAVLRIEPYALSLVYRSGIATLRSSAHRVKLLPEYRKHDPKPKNRDGELTKTTWLPPEIRAEEVLSYDLSLYEGMRNSVSSILLQCDPYMVGSFVEGSRQLEDFRVPVRSVWRTANKGQCEGAQKYLSDAVAADEGFLELFDRLVQIVLANLKHRLVKAMSVSDEEGSVTFYYQRPPTIRIQPGPARAEVKPHNDAEYGHQNGELNFWIPLTDRSLNEVDLHCETQLNENDFHPIEAKPGEIISFHGSSCRHYVNANSTHKTRMSIDFRVGVEGFFDPYWVMQGTSDDHGRQEVQL